MENLTNKDWVEIYYALDSKATAVERGEYTQSQRHKREWAAHLREIMNTIGPDGENMYEENQCSATIQCDGNVGICKTVIKDLNPTFDCANCPDRRP